MARLPQCYLFFSHHPTLAQQEPVSVEGRIEQLFINPDDLDLVISGTLDTLQARCGSPYINLNRRAPHFADALAALLTAYSLKQSVWIGLEPECGPQSRSVLTTVLLR